MVVMSIQSTRSRVLATGLAALRAALLAVVGVAAPIGAESSEPALMAIAAPLASGIPEPLPEGFMPLTLQEAVVRGLEHNLAVVLGREEVRSAIGSRDAVRSRLYPRLDASLIGSRNVINLEAYGFPVAPGESPLIGPFDVLDARATMAAPVVDLSLWAEARATSHRADAAAATLDDLRDQVVLAVSSLYLKASAADSRIVAVQAQLATAHALRQQAADMKAAGVAAGVEVLRAEVQLAAEQERLIIAENDAATSKLALARAIGLPLASTLVLNKQLESSPVTISVDEALRQAAAQRADLRSAQAAVAAAEETVAAAQRSALPSLEMHASWGKIGPGANNLLTTYAVGAMVSVPLFTGGAIHARRLMADASLADRRARLADLSARIEYEVRSALLDLEAADQRTRVADDAVRLAETQLVQARDRFSAGVADGVEVVQAQQAAATANDSLIASLLADSLAKVRLARALGVAAEDLDRFLGGSR
jgi:outer membrane protein TolC